MLRRIKAKIIEKYNKTLFPYSENIKNKNVINSFNKILKNSKNSQRKYKNLLIDGGFYNLGYFYRLQLLRAALKGNQIKEHAFIWDCNIKLCKKLLKSIGIKNISCLKGDFDKEIFSKVPTKITSKEDLLNIKLPFNILSLYDSVPKLQKSKVVINDENLKLISIDFYIQ